MSKTIAFVFPGQGSQSVGMLNDFAQDPLLTETFSEADKALGVDQESAVELSKLIAQGPVEQLNLTTNTQPAMLLAGFIAWKAWCNAEGPQAQVMAGHSLGEYTALTAAGLFSLEDALRLVRVRANAMQSAVPVGQGGMAAILGLSDDLVRQACEAAAQGQVVEAVNFNAPAQVVIAGDAAAVQRACEAAKALGAKRALPLPVSAPFHSSLLQPAGPVLKAALQQLDLKPISVDVINNVDVQINLSNQAIVDALIRQAYNPVRWVEIVQAFAARGVTDVIEFGPGKVLSGLIKRIEPSINAMPVFDRSSLAAALDSLK